MKYGARKRSESACSDADVDYAQAESELAKLHRQYRILECHRKAYLDESRNIMRKQRSHIDILEKDNAEVDIDLNLARSHSNDKHDKQRSLLLRKFVVESKEMNELIDEERKKIDDLNRRVAGMEEEIQARYRDLGGCQIDTIRHKSTQKHNRVMENRLHKATVTFNTTLTTNAKLRDQIEHLRRERALYDCLYRKLTKEQDEVKREMCDVIEESTLAYDSRDEAHSKMTALRDRSEKDQTTYNLEVKELKRIIDHEQNLKEFMNVKAQERTEQKAIEAAKRKKRAEELAIAHPPSYSEEMEQFEAAMGRIIEIEKQSDLDILVRKFIQKEDANFALFNYVNELNNDIECFQRDIKGLSEDMLVFKEQGLVVSDQRRKIMKDLEGKCSILTKELSTNENAMRKTNKRLDLVKSSVIGICRRIGCDDSSILEKLGCSDGITNDNALSYLGLIEQLANEFLLIKKYQKAKEASGKGDPGQQAQNAKQAASITAARLRPVSVASVHILPPTIEQVEQEESDSDSETSSIDETQPLPPEVLRSRAAKMVQRKERKRDKVSSKTPAPNEGQNKVEKQ
ncbi:coiled-coil domain-containing protein 63-like [Apostichopus japonicus]